MDPQLDATRRKEVIGSANRAYRASGTVGLLRCIALQVRSALKSSRL